MHLSISLFFRKEDIYINLKIHEAKNILAARISCLHDAREPLTFGKKEIGKESLEQGNGNFLTGSNSFVVKENNPLNQFQMYSEVLFLFQIKIL